MRWPRAIVLAASLKPILLPADSSGSPVAAIHAAAANIKQLMEIPTGWRARWLASRARADLCRPCRRRVRSPVARYLGGSGWRDSCGGARSTHAHQVMADASARCWPIACG